MGSGANTPELTLAAQPVLAEVGATLVAAMSSTPSSLSLAAFAGQFVTVQADGAKLYYVLGPAGVTVDETAVAGDPRAALIADGDERSFFLRSDTPNKTLSFKAASGTGFVRIYASSKPITQV